MRHFLSLIVPQERDGERLDAAVRHRSNFFRWRLRFLWCGKRCDQVPGVTKSRFGSIIGRGDVGRVGSEGAKVFSVPDFPKFTAQHQKVLHNLRIDEHTPGTIVHDFDAMLAFFREKEQSLTDTLQLPLKLLPLLNARMAHPVPTPPPRSGIKAYPHLFGLYLLLRSCAMTRLEWRGSKVFLKIDASSYAQWQTLSPAERYGSLLEIWLEYANGYTLHSTFQFRFGAWHDVSFMFMYIQNWPARLLPDLLSHVQKAQSGVAASVRMDRGAGGVAARRQRLANHQPELHASWHGDGRGDCEHAGTV